MFPSFPVEFLVTSLICCLPGSTKARLTVSETCSSGRRRRLAGHLFQDR